MGRIDEIILKLEKKISTIKKDPNKNNKTNNKKTFTKAYTIMEFFRHQTCRKKNILKFTRWQRVENNNTQHKHWKLGIDGVLSLRI